ncbi:MAG: hypothetical protein ACI9WC_000436 [Arenicella sp.]|jgi:hypothetical protein
MGSRGRVPILADILMRRLFSLYIYGFATLTLAACDPHDWNDPNRNDTPKSWDKRPFTDAECLRKGGSMILAGEEQYAVCVRPFPDSGELCSTNDDCTGACLFDPAGSPVETGDTATGLCQVDDNPSGTFIKIEHGIVQSPIVVE